MQRPQGPSEMYCLKKNPLAGLAVYIQVKYIYRNFSDIQADPPFKHIMGINGQVLSKQLRPLMRFSEQLYFCSFCINWLPIHQINLLIKKSLFNGASRLFLCVKRAPSCAMFSFGRLLVVTHPMWRSVDFNWHAITLISTAVPVVFGVIGTWNHRDFISICSSISAFEAQRSANSHEAVNWRGKRQEEPRLEIHMFSYSKRNKQDPWVSDGRGRVGGSPGGPHAHSRLAAVCWRCKLEGRGPLAKDTSSDNPFCAVCRFHLPDRPTKIRLLHLKQNLESAPCGITHTWAWSVQAGMQFGNTRRIRSLSPLARCPVLYFRAAEDNCKLAKVSVW